MNTSFRVDENIMFDQEIGHVESDDDWFADFDQLRRQVKIALNIRGINDVDNYIIIIR